jgi:hypothetical protein
MIPPNCRWLPDMPHRAAQMGKHLVAVEGFPRLRVRDDAVTGRCVTDLDRQAATFVVMSVEQ